MISDREIETRVINLEGKKSSVRRGDMREVRMHMWAVLGEAFDKDPESIWEFQRRCITAYNKAQNSMATTTAEKSGRKKAKKRP